MADFQIVGRRLGLAGVLMAGACLSACVSPSYPTRADRTLGAPPAGQGVYKVGQPYQVGGIWYVPREQPDYDQTGVASWYGDAFHMKATANGETFDMARVSAAHTTLPLPSMVEVTNLDNGRALVVRVNDRGPFVGDRIIDLSREAARQLGYERQGLARVRVRYVGPAPLVGPSGGVRYAATKPLPTRLPAAPMAMTALASSPSPVTAMAPEAAPFAARPAPSPGAITTEALPPLTGSAISSAPIAAAPTTTAAPIVALPGTPVVVTSALRVQAGAFASEANARIAARQLARAGAAVVEPVESGGLTLYRVTLPAPADEAAAYALRDRVAEIGFADARVVRTF